jgi:hypothetical protein
MVLINFDCLRTKPDSYKAKDYLLVAFKLGIEKYKHVCVQLFFAIRFTNQIIPKQLFTLPAMHDIMTLLW